MKALQETLPDLPWLTIAPTLNCDETTGDIGYSRPLTT